MLGKGGAYLKYLNIAPEMLKILREYYIFPWFLYHKGIYLNSFICILNLALLFYTRLKNII